MIDHAAIAIAQEDAERRELRAAYLAAGGSKRRSLQSFQTTADKRRRREDHAARIHAAVDALREPAGFENWLEALELNPQLSPMNAALVALQTPGEMVNTAAGWKRAGSQIRKGERASGWITAPGFWPKPYFCAAQAGAETADDLGLYPEPSSDCEALRTALTASLDGGEKPRLVLEAIARQKLGAGDD